MEYPIITRIKERREVVIDGRTEIVEETIIHDYGKQGKSKAYIMAPKEDNPVDIDGLNRILGKMGYQLAI